MTVSYQSNFLPFILKSRKVPDSRWWASTLWKCKSTWQKVCEAFNHHQSLQHVSYAGPRTAWETAAPHLHPPSPTKKKKKKIQQINIERCSSSVSESNTHNLFVQQWIVVIRSAVKSWNRKSFIRSQFAFLFLLFFWGFYCRLWSALSGAHMSHFPEQTNSFSLFWEKLGGCSYNVSNSCIIIGRLWVLPVVLLHAVL